MTDKAVIIAIGSELLSGQITNRNAAWLSARLFELGIAVCEHLVVDDVEADIVDALRGSAGKARHLVLTGGLGPTSDDLTRQAVAKFAGKALRFDPPSWQHIQDIFARLRSPVPETNRQQCYFPEGARVLVNKAGTANAFALPVDGVQVFVLPGPPREVETVWNDHVRGMLESAVPAAARAVVRMWRTIGRGESHIAEIVEKVAGNSGVELAYRAHAPFIETKIRYRAAEAAKHASLVEALDQALAPWLFEADDEDVTSAFTSLLTTYKSINLYDGATHGNLVELLAPQLRERRGIPPALSLATSWETHDSPALFVRNCLSISDDVELALAVAGYDDGEGWAVGVRTKDRLTVLEKPSPYRGEALRARNQKAVAALAVRAFYDILSGSSSGLS
jgi:molybdenum cofactor synthesis domain-containing protein